MQRARDWWLARAKAEPEGVNISAGVPEFNPEQLSQEVVMECGVPGCTTLTDRGICDECDDWVTEQAGDARPSADAVQLAARALARVSYASTHEDQAKAALEAVHYAELVRLLKETRWYVKDSLIDEIEALLAKIGGGS